MEILISVLIAILSYKIKLVDDRESNNFERLKNFLRRSQGLSDHDLGEFDEWLDKDIQYQLMGEYEATIKNKNEKRKQAILDYYKDFDDNRGSRKILGYFILINVLLLAFIVKVKVSILFVCLFIFLPTVIVCLLSPVSNIFNNPIVNVDNSFKSKEIYKNIEKKIKLEIVRIKLKGQVLVN